MRFDQLLPSPFYRVSVKLIIQNDEGDLLLVRTDEGWEMPGGGWEHKESFDDCVNREVKEELGVGVESCSDVLFIYKGLNIKNYMAIRLVVRAKLSSLSFQPQDNEVIETRFVKQEELLSLPMGNDESPIKSYINTIWPA